jgi:alkanesulfonate monooxygenase SsuD/methylene tetrahydromethanopterin reductase-like flavin-dependent oxidoreductase (luciferase family)
MSFAVNASAADAGERQTRIRPEVTMEVWLFDIMMWPYSGDKRLLYPFPGSAYDRQLGHQFYQDHLRFYVRGDELGYDAVCFTEHHYGTNGLSPSPNVMASAVAARTSHAKLALMGNCLPIHGHPVRIAEELAMLDNLSNGRVVSGFFRGGFLEYYAYSIGLEDSREKFEEGWELIVRAWTENEPFEWHGKHYQYDAVSILPRPVQQPHPPLIMAGHTRESVQWAARKRVPLAASFGPTEVLARTFDYYREYAEQECGWKPGPEHCLISRQVYVAETNARAREEAEEHIMQFFRESPVLRKYEGKLEEMRQAMQTERGVSYKDGEQKPQAPARAPGAMTFDRFQEDGFCIIGDPDYVITQMRRQSEALGAGIFLTYVPFSTLPLPLATKSIELFARECLPTLRAEAAPVA